MKIFFAFALLAGALALPLRAENPSENRPMPGVTGRLQAMKNQLQLTSEQTAAVEAALKEEMDARRATMEEMRTKQMAIKEKFDAKMASILKPEQLEKFKAMRGNVQQRMQERREMRGGPGSKKP